jgi:transglutaminase-like putative cysteine protease
MSVDREPVDLQERGDMNAAASGHGGSMSLGRRIRAELAFDVTQAAQINLQVRSASSAGRVSRETFTVTLDEGPVTSLAEIDTEYGGTIDDFHADPGRLSIVYSAEVDAAAEPSALLPACGTPLLEQHRMLRPSRYCPSDHLAGLASAEFGHLTSPGEQVAAIARWIHGRVGYVPGASSVHDSAEHTLLTGEGVCRDFAHLGIVLCRALDVPARFASVYAPGLDPMDFHAVFEARHDGAWWVYDATRLAPRHSLVRIATGRDAADTSFATVSGGLATLTGMTVTATVDGELPIDTHDGPIVLP